MHNYVYQCIVDFFILARESFTPSVYRRDRGVSASVPGSKAMVSATTNADEKSSTRRPDRVQESEDQSKSQWARAHSSSVGVVLETNERLRSSGARKPLLRQVIEQVGGFLARDILG